MSCQIGRKSSRCTISKGSHYQGNGSSCESRNFRGKSKLTFQLDLFFINTKKNMNLLEWKKKSISSSCAHCVWFVLQLKIAYSHLDEFCKLPAETKELYLRNTETGNHGYVKPGQERFDGKTKDIRHAYNICTLNQRLPEEVSLWCSTCENENDRRQIKILFVKVNGILKRLRRHFSFVESQMISWLVEYFE